MEYLYHVNIDGSNAYRKTLTELNKYIRDWLAAHPAISENVYVLPQVIRVETEKLAALAPMDFVIATLRRSDEYFTVCSDRLVDLLILHEKNVSNFVIGQEVVITKDGEQYQGHVGKILSYHSEDDTFHVRLIFDVPPCTDITVMVSNKALVASRACKIFDAKKADEDLFGYEEYALELSQVIQSVTVGCVTATEILDLFRNPSPGGRCNLAEQYWPHSHWIRSLVLLQINTYIDELDHTVLKGKALNAAMKRTLNAIKEHITNS